MVLSPRPGRSGWGGLAFSQLLALAFLAACFWWVAKEVGFIFANHKILVALSMQEKLGSALGRQLAAFAGVALLVHAVFGLLAFALARLTEAAFPNRINARREMLIAGWFILLAGVAMAANTTWFASSHFAGDESWWRGLVFGIHPVQFVVAFLTLVILALAWRAAAGLQPARRAPVAIAAIAILASLAGLMLSRSPDASASVASVKPHVVLIGIDSLRNDLIVPRRGPMATPHVRSFLDGARRFNDATSPLARTYGSWVSILTGRHPVATNARVNLMPRRLVHEGETLADALRSHDYRTIYATDEVRFANFDRSFGFDQLITPPIGAVDFVLGYAGDMPLVNLIASTRAGGRLFPSNHANRAANVTYRPRQFVERLENELTVEGPSFITIHLTLAHWPYAWAGMPVPTVPEAYRDSYRIAVSEVDRQFGDVLEMLRRKHVLDNAVVVLLSDHGEALGADDDSMLRTTGTSREIWDSLWGHGTSVMSPNQYQVLLAMRAFGRARLPGPELDYDWPVSLEDLRPTLEEYAIGRPPASVDGVSLVPYFSDPERAKALATRIRFTETDFNTTDTLAGRYEASGIIDEAALYYEVARESGWVQFRESRLPELLARKQRAAMTSQTLLAAIPGPPGQGPRYLLVDRDDPEPRLLEGPPDASQDPEPRRLWDALQARFPGEMTAAPVLP